MITFKSPETLLRLFKYTRALNQKEMLMSSQRAPAANESKERARQFRRHFRPVPFKVEVTVWSKWAHMDDFFVHFQHYLHQSTNPLILSCFDVTNNIFCLKSRHIFCTTSGYIAD